MRKKYIESESSCHTAMRAPWSGGAGEGREPEAHTSCSGEDDASFENRVVAVRAGAASAALGGDGTQIHWKAPESLGRMEHADPAWSPAWSPGSRQEYD